MKSINVSHITVFFSLLFSLFVYLFFRSDQTVVNELFRWIFSGELYFHWKSIVSTNISLPNFLVFSLPEGLWVLAATIVSKNIFIQLKSFSYPLALTPLWLAFLLEFFQFTGITKGTFDWLDLATAITFWATGYFLLPNASTKQDLFKEFKLNSIVCVSCYLALYLSHVSQ